MTEEQCLGFLSQIQCPTLVVEAEQGFVQEYAEKFAKRLEKIERLVHQRLPGGHYLHLENPGPTAGALLDFL